MKLEHYISELLYRYNCVMVPNMGAFLTQMKSAAVNDSNSFHPPSKVISFNEQVVTNDGLLVSYMADAEKKSYEEMLEAVTEMTANWKEKLQEGKRLKLDNIGELWINQAGKIQFQPQYTVNYLTSSFGLSSFDSAPVVREVLKEEVTELEEAIPFVFTPEQRKKSSFRPYLKYAAIFLLAVSTGLTGMRYLKETSTTKQLVQEEAQERVTQHIQEATFFDMEPLELPAISLDVMNTSAAKKELRIHHIVAGAFRFRKNADRKIQQLKKRGYNASYIGTNAFGLHMVNYGSYSDVNKALLALKKIKRTESKEAWLKSSK